jgi:hypothetical protein
LHGGGNKQGGCNFLEISINEEGGKKIQKNKRVSSFIREMIVIARLVNMALPVVEFSREGYKIRKVFG